MKIEISPKENSMTHVELYALCLTYIRAVDWYNQTLALPDLLEANKAAQKLKDSLK